MNVFENVAFGLQIKKKDKQEIKMAVKEALHMVQLDPLVGSLNPAIILKIVVFPDPDGPSNE